VERSRLAAERWPRKIIIKGILDAEDASRQSTVSTCGGFQSRGVSSMAGHDIRAAGIVGRGRPMRGCSMAVWQDGRIKALALGAKSLIGKAFLTLAARGEAGVTLALDIMGNSPSVSRSPAPMTCAKSRATSCEPPE
jgi:hypothetical protein